jgi:hypothetical protein
MKKIMTLLILVLLISWTGICFADDKHDDGNKIALQLKPFNVSDNSFYIKDIIMVEKTRVMLVLFVNGVLVKAQ